MPQPTSQAQDRPALQVHSHENASFEIVNFQGLQEQQRRRPAAANTEPVQPAAV